MKRTKFRLLPMLMALLFILTGCVNVDYHMTVNSDLSLDVEAVVLTNTNSESTLLSGLSESAVTAVLDGYQEQLRASGYDVSDYTEDGATGFRAAMHCDNIEEISSSGNPSVPMSQLSYGTKRYLFFDRMAVNAGLDISDLMDTVLTSQTYDLSGLSGLFTDLLEQTAQAKFSLTLPIPITETNAALSEDGRTATWTVQMNGENTFVLQQVVPNMPLLLGGIAAVFVLLFAGILLLMLGRKRQSRGMKNVGGVCLVLAVLFVAALTLSYLAAVNGWFGAVEMQALA